MMSGTRAYTLTSSTFSDQLQIIKFEAARGSFESVENSVILSISARDSRHTTRTQTSSSREVSDDEPRSDCHENRNFRDSIGVRNL
jgi:hypothetical protein